jgi:hypothetical protein
MMTVIYNVISPIFKCCFIWVRKLVRFGEGRTQIEGVRSPGVSIWIPKTQVLYQSAEEWCTVSLLPHGAISPHWARAFSLSRLHDYTYNDIPQLGTNDQPRRRDLYMKTLTTDIHLCLLRDSDPQFSKRAAEDPRLRPRGHSGRL